MLFAAPRHDRARRVPIRGVTHGAVTHQSACGTAGMCAAT